MFYMFQANLGSSYFNDMIQTVLISAIQLRATIQ